MPREIAWFEDALACMAGTGLTEARKASVIMLLSGYVRNLAATEADIAAAVAASGLGLDQWMASYPAMLGQLTDPRRFPALTAFIAAEPEAADGPTTSSCSAWTASWMGSGCSSGSYAG
jgi:hypothetical protein